MQDCADRARTSGWMVTPCRHRRPPAEQVNDRHSLAEPWLWCERVEMDTASPVDREQAAGRDDFAGDLARLSAELREDPKALEELRNLLRPLYVNSNAGLYLKDHLPSVEELAEMVDAASEESLAALIGPQEEAGQ